MKGSRRELLAWVLVALLAFAFFGKETIVVKDRAEHPSVSLPSVSGKKLNEVVKLDGSELGGILLKKSFTFHRPFSAEDVKIAKLAVRFAEELTGEKYEENYYKNLYWSDDMLKNAPGLLGMTAFHDGLKPWQSYIVIASEIKPKDFHDLNVMRDFASVLIHEWSHAKTFSHELITRYKINMVLEMSFDYYYNTSVSVFYGEKLALEHKGKPYNLMLEKAAFDAGIPQPYIYVRDWSGSEIGGTLRSLGGPSNARIY